MADPDQTFAAALRRLRQRAGLTQDQLAEKAGLSTNAVGALERGIRRRPYAGTVQSIAAALNLTPPELDELIQLSRAEPVAEPEPAQRPLPVPRQLPAAMGTVTGRSADLAELHALLAGGARTIAISGTPGVGKTTLAVAWAHQLRERFPDGQLYANLRGYDPGAPADPAEILDGFLRALDVPARKIPPGLEQRGALFRSLTDGARLLVVLDNANSADQVRPLLPGSAPSLVVITSRASLTGLAISAGAARVNLDLLAAPDAEALLRSIIGAQRADAEPAAVTELARLCARLPLALQLGGQRAAAHPELLLAGLVAELASEPERLELLSAAADEATAARAVFSWSYRNLPDPQARLFRLLGVHPGPEVSVASAAALAGLPQVQARRLLLALADAHLVDAVEPGRFRMHDLLHAYARELAESDGLTAELPRLAGFYLHTAAAADRALNPVRGRTAVDGAPPPSEPIEFASDDEAMHWCEQELPVVVAVVRAAAAHGLAAAAWQLANAMWSFFYLTKHRSEWMETHHTGLRAAEAAGDLAGQARMLNGVAPGSALADATVQLRRASALFGQIGDRRGEASALVNLGDSYLHAGDFAESARYSEEAIRIVRGTSNAYVEAAAVCNLGEAYLGLGRPVDAVDTFAGALELCLGSGNRVGAAVAYVHLGEGHLALGRHEEAVGHLTEGLALCRDNGDRHGEARALIALGQLRCDTGAPTTAREHWEQAVQVLDAMADDRGADIRDRLRRLGGGRRRSPGEPLTPAEERIANLVAGGLTNREAARIARVSPKTVEVNLSRVYRKLGVRNRTELANHLQTPKP